MKPIACGVCRLRRWRASDIDSLIRHANNRNVWLGVRDRFPHPYTRQAAKVFLEAMEAEDPATTLSIEVEGEAAGGVGVVPGTDVNSHTGEIGYWLGPAFWNRGIATAAVQGFVPYATSTFGLRRLVAETFATNLSSIRVLEKCGFAREGVLRQHARKDGRYVDQIVYGLLLL